MSNKNNNIYFVILVCSSPGYGVTLIAESTTGVFLAGELLFCKDGRDTILPEDLGQQAADLMFQEILSVCVLVCIIIAFQDVMNIELVLRMKYKLKNRI